MTFEDKARVFLFIVFCVPAVIYTVSQFYWNAYYKGLKQGFNRGREYQKYLGDDGG